MLSGYLVVSQDLEADVEDIELTAGWYIRPQDRAMFGNERRLIDRTNCRSSRLKLAPMAQ
jgi:hypothetical protein